MNTECARTGAKCCRLNPQQTSRRCPSSVRLLECAQIERALLGGEILRQVEIFWDRTGRREVRPGTEQRNFRRQSLVLCNEICILCVENAHDTRRFARAHDLRKVGQTQVYLMPYLGTRSKLIGRSRSAGSRPAWTRSTQTVCICGVPGER